MEPAAGSANCPSEFLSICKPGRSRSCRSRCLWRVAARDGIWPRMVPAKCIVGLGSLSLRPLGKPCTVGLDMGWRRGLGLCALPLWPLGLLSGPLGLDSRTAYRSSGLFTGTSRLCRGRQFWWQRSIRLVPIRPRGSLPAVVPVQSPLYRQGQHLEYQGEQECPCTEHVRECGECHEHHICEPKPGRHGDATRRFCLRSRRAEFGCSRRSSPDGACAAHTAT